MKKTIFCLFAVALVWGMCSCSQSKEATVVNTFEQTPLDQIEEYRESAKEVRSTTYYEMSDGTWKTDEYSYPYRLVITGKLGGSAQEIAYTILSNSKDITFEQAWKASGLSSDSDDYFKVEDAVFVATKIG
ncbi:MAG: hypothetical protein PHE47_09250 [Oscillospiraceae bacterium]|nr:hypothetical protein [Oscillospiraceae bacterium]